ncbi:MAG: hypothetical protein JWL90_34 [Chthoniobacteraceae bacterium]|nr:hypothetical protein [Chthoniobacteraceae bacterium]
MSALPLVPPVTICVLCYGDYPQLARRILESLLRHTPATAMRLRIGLNAVSRETIEVVDSMAPRLPVEFIVHSETNLYKLPMMRRLFHDRPIGTPWTIWFDDDSYVVRGDWLSMLACESQLQPGVGMWGKPLYTWGSEDCRQFIREAEWFKGLEPLDDNIPGRCRLNFIAGGFWAIRTTYIHQLGWPDRRLIHFGDDYMLGEAMRQIGARLGQASSGIAINQCSRRAPSHAPRCEVLH